MSANLYEEVLIDVTRGDCVDDNRKSGKSNTGTYFLCSIKNFDLYDDYFKDGNKYKIDLVKFDIYRLLFEKYFFQYKDEYIGKMKTFNGYCDYILSQFESPEIRLSLRKNDSRVFMKFSDNTEKITNAFRHVLYEDLSLIGITKKNNIYYVYPVINLTFINKKKNESSDLVIDEEE